MEKSLPGYKDYLDASIKTAQYLTGLTVKQDIWRETVEVLVSFFGADIGAVGVRRPNAEICVYHWTSTERFSGLEDLESETREAIAEVFESGFIALRVISSPNPLSLAFLPITQENQVIAVMVAGHGMSEPLPKELLNVYLAVAGLAGTTASRLASEQELRRHRLHLEQMVQEQTTELTKANEQLRREIAERVRVEETLRIEKDNLVAIFEAMEDDIYIANLQGYILYGNSSLEKDFGPCEGRRCFEYLNNLTEPCPWCRFPEVQAGETVRWEHYFSKSGKTYDIIETPLRNSNESVKLTIFRDITERKRVEDALRESRELLNAIVEGTSDAVYVKDANGRFRLYNRAASRFTGKSPEEVIGRDVTFFFSEEEARAVMEKDRALMAHGGTITYEEEFVLHGKRMSFLTTKGALTDMDGEVSGLFGITRDITELKRMEAERLEMERRLLNSQKMESLGVLAGGIAHDFNNLLTVIVGNLELALLRVTHDTVVRCNIEDSLKACQRAARHICQLLDYAGKGRFLLRKTDLNGVVRENEPLFRSAISRERELDVVTASDLPGIKADPDQLRQVIMNLVINAAEAIDEGPGVITVSTGVLECDERCLSLSRLDEKPLPGSFVYLEVSDTGPGMDEETRKRLFEPFYTTKFMGRGLGMSAVLGIVRVHGGAILLESEAGRGTVVRVLFPVIDDSGMKANEAVQ
jgi:PAS domain S-box-containing protein